MAIERQDRPIRFEWDSGNTDKVVSRHNVTPSECESVFGNRPILILEDTAHSQKERRFLARGQTGTGRYLILAFTLRGEKVRVVSARDMNKKERREYEKTKTNPEI